MWCVLRAGIDAKPARIFYTMFLKPAVLDRKFRKFEVNPNEFVFRGLELDVRVGTAILSRTTRSP